VTLGASGAEIGAAWIAQQRVMIGLTVAFIAINAGIPVAPQSLIAEDSTTFLRMAEQFLATGAFTEEERQPLYPLAMAGALRVAGSNGLQLLVALQVVMLFATGVLAWMIARDWLEEGATAVFGLVILNPNALANAHWPLADTLHALLFSAAIFFLLSYARRGGTWRALACGVAMGLAALSRPESTLLVYLLPIAIPLVRWSNGDGESVRRGLALGVGALVAALIVVSPWMAHNQRAGNGLSMTGGAKAADVARFHYSYAEAARTYTPQVEMIAALHEAELQLLIDKGVGGNPEAEQRQFLARYYLRHTVDGGPLLVMELLARAWVSQFVSGGAQSMNRLFDIVDQRPDKIMNSPGFFTSFTDGLRSQSLAAAAITVASVGFALVARTFGLAGFAVMVQRRLWPLLLVIVAVLAFKGLVHVFIGLSRYRLGVEPLLMILAVVGWQGLRAKFAART
jgi:4-amino-4-deoxy-L-arabinose transferase-like glycosyltransferase